MVPPNATRIVDGYLVRIAVAARDLPAEQVEELLTEIREHIDAALASSGDIDATAAAGAAPGAPPAAVSPARGVGLGPQEIAAVLLLLVGGFIVGVGWIVGVVLLWTSDRWSTGVKLLGTLVWPFGIAGVYVLFPWAISAGAAISPLHLLALIAPLVTAGVLVRAARTHHQSATPVVAGLAGREHA